MLQPNHTFSLDRIEDTMKFPMEKRKKILVPVDFSRSSENAFRHALLSADKLDAEITLIHFLTPDIPIAEVPIAPEIVMQEQIKITRQKLQAIHSKITDKVLQLIKKIPVVWTKIEVGYPPAVIKIYAETNAFDFIFIGTRDQHGTMDKIFGSVTSKVIRNAPCLVMVIPEFTAYRDRTVVAYSTNLEEVDAYEIWNLSKILQAFNPIIRCVHFKENKKDFNPAIKMEELQAFFSENVPALPITFHDISTSNKEMAMLDFLENYDINLLVTYRPESTFWKDLFHKSFTKKMAFTSKVPLLVLRKK